jgi:mono/diheme cytochrome c family protein
MNKVLMLSLVLAGFGTAAAAQTDADEFALGRAEYLAACAACHGENGDGNGPIATMFSGKVPDVTGLSARNDGVFPTVKIFQIIDGRTGIRAHGNPMPIFGNRYLREVGDAFGPYGTETEVRARVLELVFYIQSIQQ